METETDAILEAGERLLERINRRTSAVQAKADEEGEVYSVTGNPTRGNPDPEERRKFAEYLKGGAKYHYIRKVVGQGQ